MMDTFLDVPEFYSELANSNHILLPVPYDGTSTFIKGADKGPQAILDASDSLELYDIIYDTEAYTAGIYVDHYQHDLASPDAMVKSVYDRVKHFLNQKKQIGLLGGEHSISIGAIEAFSEQYPDLSVIQIDAHADLREEYHDSRFNHACVMRRAQERARVVQVGIRSVCEEERENIIPENIFYAHEIHNHNNWIQQAIDRLTPNVYLTIDLDGFDPSILPATGTPLPGGLSWYSVLHFLDQLFKQRKIVGFDVVELCPQSENKISDVLAASLVYKIITLLELNK